MSDYKIIYTEPSDRETIHWIFEEAIAYQKRKGFPAWVGYDKKQLRDEMEKRQQYKIDIAGELACVFSVFHSDKVIWEEREKGDSIYLHRIVVHPNFKGQNMFRKILDWSIKYATEKGREHIRMDTWADNPNIIAYYKKHGFKFVDNFTTPDTEELAPHYRNQKLALLEYKIENKG